MGILVLRYSTLKLIMRLGSRLGPALVMPMAMGKVDVEGPEAEASSSMAMGLCISSTWMLDIDDCPVAMLVIRAGPTSVGDSSIITAFTASCRTNQTSCSVILIRVTAKESKCKGYLASKHKIINGQF